MRGDKMSRMKTLKIWRCDQCHFMTDEGDMTHPGCTQSMVQTAAGRQPKRLHYTSILPSWCPLPDAESEENDARP